MTKEKETFFQLLVENHTQSVSKVHNILSKILLHVHVSAFYAFIRKFVDKTDAYCKG